MTCLTTTRPETTTPVSNSDPEYLDALERAMTRARHSYFDQHIVRTDDGCCWVADEGSYETLIADMADRIVLTIPAGRSDES